MCAAGVRGGKTYSATVELLRSIYRDVAAGKGKKPAGTGRRRQPRLLYWVVAPTTKLNVYVHRYIQSECPHELIERVYDDAIWLKPDVLVEFKTAERPELLVGASVNGLLIDEACRVRAEAWDGALRGRIADTAGFVILASSPSGGKNSWVYQRFVVRSGNNDIQAFSWRTIDNTAVPQLAIDVEQARATMASSWFRREFEASWDSFGGTIYEEFSDANITTEAALRLKYGAGSMPTHTLAQRLFKRVLCGVDFGWTSPGAMVVVGDLGSQLVVLEESYAAMRPIVGPGDRTWLAEARRLREKWNVSLFACDPARPDAINDFANNGLPAVAAFNDIYLGIRRVSEAIHTGMLVLDTCSNLIGEMRSYQWQPNRDQTGFGEVPASGQADHACDALRYATVEHRPYAIQKQGTTSQSLVRGPWT